MYPVSKSSGRAWRYISRRRRKTAVLALIFFVLCLLSLLGMTVENGVSSSLLELREQFFGSLTVEPSSDTEYRVTPETAERAVEKVAPDGWTGRCVCYLSMEKVSLIPGKFTQTGDPAMYISKIFAGRDSSLAREFTAKELELTEGRHIQPEDERKILISDALAEANGLNVGDFITGTVTDETVIHAQTGIGSSYEFEIVGIFRVLKEQSSSVIPAECDILENLMFADETFGFSMAEEIWQMPRYYNMGITLWLKDPEKLEPALECLKSSPEEPDWDHYLIRTNSVEYDQSAAPLGQMKTLVRIFLLLIFAVGAILLLILLSMWNRERMPEIGILLSLGCPKGQVLRQMLCENAVLYFLGFAAALPVAEVGSLGLSTVFAMEIGHFGAAGAGLTGAGGLALCMIVTWLSGLWIMRKNPMDILVAVV